MYAGRPWTVRQYAGFSTAEESNAFYRRQSRGGADGALGGLSICPPTAATTPIIPASPGDVGQAGVAVDSVEDMKILFDGIPLDKMSVSMTMNGAVLPVMGMYIAAAEEQGADASLLAGTLQNDILKEFMVRNTYIYPPEPSMRIVADIIRLHIASRNMPRFNPCRSPATTCRRPAPPASRNWPSPSPTASSTCGPPGEGLEVDAFAPRLSFFFGVRHELLHGDRQAARRPAAVGRRNMMPRSSSHPQIRVPHAAHPLPDVRREPDRRIPTTTSSAPPWRRWRRHSAVPSRLHTNSFDEALALPSEFSARIARNTQLVLQEESGLTRVVDPLGGSYLHRSLTASLVGGRAEDRRRGRGDGWHDQGRRGRHAETAHRRGRRTAPGRIDSRRRSHRRREPYRPEEEEAVETLDIDNTVRPRSPGRPGSRVPATRDNACRRALDALADRQPTAAPGPAGAGDRGGPPARATVGRDLR